MQTNIVTCRCRCGARWEVDLAPIDRRGIDFACVACHQEIKVALDPETGRYMHWDWPPLPPELTAPVQLC